MTSLEKDILAALVDLDTTVKSMATARTKPPLQPLFARLDALADQLPADTDPGLLHYLRKKSYAKARLLLEGRDADNARGSCRQD